MSLIFSKYSGMLDADLVLPRLYLGGQTALTDIDRMRPQPEVVVSAASGVVPPKYSDTSIVVQHLPLDDTPTDWRQSSSTWMSVVAMGRYVATQWAQGKTVLVVCFAGMNRSALVVGVALRFLGFTGPDAVKQIRETRGVTLMNTTFRDAVLNMQQPEKIVLTSPVE